MFGPVEDKINKHDKMKTKRSIFNGNVCKAMIAVASMVSLAFVSCAEDDFGNGSEKNNDATVSFEVGYAQDAAQKKMAAAQTVTGVLTRAAFSEGLSLQRLSQEDLGSQQLSVYGVGIDAGELCLMENTTAGIDVPGSTSTVSTRAIISTAITEDFSSIGYRGTSETGITAAPWFYNRTTNMDGVLQEEVHWQWAYPYARFYGVSPQVKDGDAKLTLSAEDYAGTPYVDFEVEQDVEKQRAL